MSLKKLPILLISVLTVLFFASSCYAFADPEDFFLEVTSSGDDSSLSFDIVAPDSGILIAGTDVIYNISKIDSISSKYASIAVTDGAKLNITKSLTLTHTLFEDSDPYSPPMLIVAAPENDINGGTIEINGTVDNMAIITLEAKFDEGVLGIFAFESSIIFGEYSKLIVTDTTGALNGSSVPGIAIGALGEDSLIRIGDNSEFTIGVNTTLLIADGGGTISFGDNTDILSTSNVSLMKIGSSTGLYQDGINNVVFGDYTTITSSISLDMPIIDIYSSSAHNALIDIAMQRNFDPPYNTASLEFGKGTNITHTITFDTDISYDEYMNIDPHSIFYLAGGDASLILGNSTEDNISTITLNSKYASVVYAEAVNSVTIGDYTTINAMGASSSGIKMISGLLAYTSSLSIANNVEINISDPDYIPASATYMPEFPTDGIAYGIYAIDTQVEVMDNLIITTNGAYQNGIKYIRTSADLFIDTSDYHIDYYEGATTTAFFSGAVNIRTSGNDSSGLILQYAVNVNNTVNGNDRSFTISTEGDRSHGLLIASFLKDTKLLDNTSNEIILDNLVIEVAGEQSNALHIVTVNTDFLPGSTINPITVADMEFSFNNMNAKSTHPTGLAIFGATGTNISITLSDSTLFGDILSTDFTHLSKRTIVISTNDTTTTIGDSYSTDVVELHLISSSWEGSRADKSPYENMEFVEFSKTLTVMSSFNTLITNKYQYGSESNDVDLTLLDNSSWIISKDSHVTNLYFLTDETSFVEFREHPTSPENDFYKAHTIETLHADISGTFIMNVNMYSPTVDDTSIGLGNHFTAGNTTGGIFNIIVASSSGKGGAYELELIEVTEDGNLADFILGNTDANNRISLGAYKYELVEKTNSTVYSWWLQRVGVDDDLKDEIGLAVLGFAEFAKSVDGSLSDELLKHRNHLWLSAYYKHQNFSSNIITGGLTQNMGGNFIGIDFSTSELFDIGQFFGLSVGRQSLLSGSYADITSLTTGIYVNLRLANLEANSYIRAATYRHDFNLVNSTGGNVKGMMLSWGYSASVQATYTFNFGTLFLQPKAKATYTHVNERSYDVGGLSTLNLTEHGLVTWLGAKIGFDKINSYDKPYGYYVEAGWIHDTNPSSSIIFDEGQPEEDKVTVQFGKDRFEIGVGFYSSPLGVSSVNIDLKYAQGKGIIEYIKLQAGASCYF